MNISEKLTSAAHGCAKLERKLARLNEQLQLIEAIPNGEHVLVSLTHFNAEFTIDPSIAKRGIVTEMNIVQAQLRSVADLVEENKVMFEGLA